MPSRPLPLHSRAASRRPKKRRRLRRGLLIALALVLAWVACNRFDTAPSPASVQLSQALPRNAADADNAWLYLYGLGAAENDDPIRLGRARAEAMNQAAGKNLIPVLDEAGQALMVDALPPIQPDSSVDSSGEQCPSFYQVDCLEWVRGHGAMLQRLREANRVRLQRIPVLLALPQWEDLRLPSVASMPIETDVRTFWLYNDLLAQQVNQALDGNDDAGLALALQQIAAVSAFWNRIARQPPSLASFAISRHPRIRQLRLLSDILDRLDANQLAAVKTSVDAMLQPTLPVDWSLALRHEYQTQQDMLLSTIPPLGESLSHCGKGELQACGYIVPSLGFARQDTLNRLALNLQEFQRELEATPVDAPHIQAEVIAARRARSPDLQHPLNLLGAVLFNPLGKFLAAEVVRDADGLSYEVEAMRRSVALKRAALATNLAPADMPAFLASQPAELRNPFTGQAFDWDPRQHEIHFRPVDNFWRMPRLNVPYRAPARSATQTCAQPLTLELTRFDGDAAQPPHSVVSCADGSAAVPAEGAAAAPRYAAVHVLLADGKLDARVLTLMDNKRVLSWEVLGAPFDGTQEIWLQPRGHDAPGQRVRLRRAVEQKPLPASTPAVPGKP